MVAWMAFTCNVGYWSLLSSIIDDSQALPYTHLAGFFLLTCGLISIVLLILAVGRLTRPVLIILLPLAAACGYFTAHYGTLIDKTMLVNVIETDRAEALELLSLPLLTTVLVAGVLPAIFVVRQRLPARPLRLAIGQRLVGLLIAVALVGGPLLADTSEIFSVARNHRELRHMMAPIDVIAAAYGYVDDRLDSPGRYEAIGLDARHDAAVRDGTPNVHVIIVGETARAANFSLNGYDRATNPELASHALYRFFEASACGTATAQSLPCMFSVQTMEEFDRDLSKHQDNLLDVAARAGYDVRWVDNGNGCKGVCARVPSRDLAATPVTPLCEGNRCYDEILIDELRRILPTVEHDTLIVLHQLGSHGPAYYRRYPNAFRRFTPDCRSDDLGDCTSEQIFNSYDNTILYTDHVVSQAIDVLDAASDRLNTSLVYVSDHGESLGEHHLYLHGIPRALAPEEQFRIPWLAWFSRGALEAQQLAADCHINPRTASHDNLFHTELGLLGISTAVYRPELDLFAGCRTAISLGNIPAIDIADS